MTILQAIILGCVQGLTEFLPISSSAHLFLTPYLLGWEGDQFTQSFDVALHVGTLAAVLWFFRTDWMALTRSTLLMLRNGRSGSTDEKRAIFLGIAFLPAVIAGLLFGEYTETVFRHPAVIGAALIILGVILWVVDRFVSNRRSLGDMRSTDALLIGISQAIALIPGVSRSGITMTTGRALGFGRAEAARFSFLMSMPIIAAAAVRKVPEALATHGVSPALLAGTVASAVTGWFAIAFLLRFLSTHGFGAFAIYRVILGAYVLYVALG